MSVIADVTRAACALYPETPSQSIARQLLRENPKLYRNLDHARLNVRMVRGQAGSEKRSGNTDKTLFRTAGATTDGIPAGIRQSQAPFKLPLPARVLVLSDLHVPYHDTTAIELALKTGRDEKCDAIYINGDLLDFYGLSRFDKDPRARTPKQEVQTAREILRVAGKPYAKSRRWFKAGNHDERWEIALHTKAPHLADFDEIALPSVLHLEEDGWGYIHGKQRAEFGLLHVLHGHELRGSGGFSSPVNAARGAWTKTNATCLVGHWHQSSNHTETISLDNRVATCWSTGCLCDLRPDYASVNKWTHGFAIVEVGTDREFQCRNFKLIDGRVYAG